MTEKRLNKSKQALDTGFILFLINCIAFFAKSLDSSTSMKEFKSSGKFFVNTFGIHTFKLHACSAYGFTVEANFGGSELWFDKIEGGC